MVQKASGHSFQRRKARMFTAFVSRELGFGRPLSEKELATINVARQGKRYLDEKAAQEINKTLDKPPLTDTPFVK